MTKLNSINSYSLRVAHYAPFLLGISFCTIITFVFREIPFFWDGGFFSETALYFYDNGYSRIVVPLNSDTGGFPLFGIYMSLWWKIFGKTLIVSHIAILPIITGVFIEFIRISKMFLKPDYVFAAVFLLLVEPTIITQAILMSYDLMLLYFSLLALNCLLKEKRALYSLALIFVAASSTRGSIIILTFLVLNISFRLINKQNNKVTSDLLTYIPVVIFISLWSVFHYLSTGWILFSPLRETEHESFSGISMIFRQFIYSLWKISDFGRIFLMAFIFICIPFFYKKLKEDKKFATIIIVLCITILVHSVSIMLFSNPVSHRYFLLIYAIIILSSLYFIQQLKSRTQKLVVFLGLALLLFTGNFWLYPQKYGNGWDSSLKVLPFFEIDNEMVRFIQKNDIKPADICTLFPLHKNYKYTHLLNYDFCFSDFDKRNFNSCRYFLYSNICNTSDPKTEIELKNNWVKLKEIKTKNIFLVLYKHV